MNKNTKIRLIVLLTPIALLYIFSPPRNVIIEIDANPQGVDKFYVEITSARGNFHGTTVRYAARQVVPINKKTTISLDSKKTLWFGRIGVKIYHPEYFYELGSTNNNFVVPKSTFTPVAWADVLAKSPSWETKYASYENRTAGYIFRKLEHSIIGLSDVHFHIGSMNNQFLEQYIEEVDDIKLHKSIQVLDLIVNEFDVGINKVSSPYMGRSEFVQNQIDETHNALAEIHEKFD